MSKAPGLVVPKPRKVSFASSAPIPRAVQVAFWLLLVPEVVGLVYFLVRLDFSTIIEGIKKGYLTRAGEVEAPVSYIVVMLVLGVIFFTGIQMFRFWTIFLARRGVKWARVLLTIGVALGLIGIVMSRTPLTVVEELVDVAAIVLLWLPAPRAYFTATSLARKQHRESQLG